jgi:hypothetical protein
VAVRGSPDDARMRAIRGGVGGCPPSTSVGAGSHGALTILDKVVVMADGRSEPIGTPCEPCNRARLALHPAG